MTHDQINLNAYDEARRAFITMILHEGYRLETANEKRELVYEASKRSRCTKCEIEKHVSQFYGKENGVQAWCNTCLKEYSKDRYTNPYTRRPYSDVARSR